MSHDVYEDQRHWMKVKKDMLEVYRRYRDTLYKAEDTDAVIEYEDKRMINRLESTASPCGPNLWFSTFTCPQIVADTYQRPVIVYCYVLTGKMKVHYESQIYFPLINMKLEDIDRPITLLLAFSHFYYIEFGRTPKGRMKTFIKPHLNVDHERLRKMYPTLCSSTDYSVLF